MTKLTSVQNGTQTRTMAVNLSAEETSMEKHFASHYREHVSQVYRYVYSKVGNVKEAEDLTSQTFLAALENFSKFQGTGPFAAWLFGIARNKVMDQYRRNEKLFFVADLPEYLADTQDVLGEVLEEEKRKQLNRILLQLKPEQIELLQLRYAAALSFAEIGAILGRSEAAVKMAVYRLQDQLREELEVDHD